MSADGGGSRAGKRHRRAEEDVRSFHRELRAVIERVPEERWERPGADGWSPAEVLLHVVLVGEKALAGLREAAARGPGRGPARAGLTVRLARRVVFTTWRLPPDLKPAPDTLPGGVVLPPEGLADRATRLAADWVAFLASLPEDLLRRLLHGHGRLGPMDAFQWARYLRIFLRDNALKLETGGRGGGPGTAGQPGGGKADGGPRRPA